MDSSYLPDKAAPGQAKKEKQGWMFVDCESCGKKTWRVNSSLKNRSKFFCSTACHGAYRSKRLVGKNHPNYNKVEVVCAWCGKPKKVKLSTYKRNSMFFCSPESGQPSSCRNQWDSVFKTGKDRWNRDSIDAKCEICGKAIDKKKSKYKNSKTKRFYCGRECMGKWMSANSEPEKSTFWKGGVKDLDVPLYDTYAPQIIFAIKCRRHKKNKELLEVKCSLCKKWHVPSLKYLRSKLSFFHNVGTHLHIYCSNGCKESCPVFRAKVFPKGFNAPRVRSEALDPETRNLVLARDNNTCQKCGSQEDLHVHHIEGVAQNPMLANDIENCIAVCKDCHAEIHSIPGCTYHDYQVDPCVDTNKRLNVQNIT